MLTILHVVLKSVASCCIVFDSCEIDLDKWTHSDLCVIFLRDSSVCLFIWSRLTVMFPRGRIPMISILVKLSSGTCVADGVGQNGIQIFVVKKNHCSFFYSHFDTRAAVNNDFVCKFTFTKCCWQISFLQFINFWLSALSDYSLCPSTSFSATHDKHFGFRIE